MYVVTFATAAPVGPGALDGLRRMSLDDARALARTASRIPKRGRIVHVETLDVTERF